MSSESMSTLGVCGSNDETSVVLTEPEHSEQSTSNPLLQSSQALGRSCNRQNTVGDSSSSRSFLLSNNENIPCF